MTSVLPRLAPTASAEEAHAALLEHGALVLEGYLPPAAAAAKRAELSRLLELAPTGRNNFEGWKTQRIYALFRKTRALDGPATDPLVLALVERVLGPAALLSAPTAISIGPGEQAQALHRDDGVYPLPRPHPELVLNTMWALDDFTEENGATRVVPGSHRAPESVAAEAAAPQLAVMPAGSVLVYLGSVLHGGGANRSGASRLGVVLEYCAGWLRPQENHFLGVPAEVVRTLAPALQELLGYSIHGRLLGNVDGRHPRKSLAASTAADRA